MAGAGVIGAGQRGGSGEPAVVSEPVSLVDLTPTLLDLAGVPTPADASFDGVSLKPLLTGGTLAARALYAESFAPLLDFGWSPLRALRVGDAKYIAAPKPELYDLSQDRDEARNLVSERASQAADMAGRIDRIAPATLAAAPVAEGQEGRRAEGQKGTAGSSVTARDTTARLQSLGYLAGASNRSAAKTDPRALPDPKDRVELAGRIGAVTSGELQGPALRSALEAIVREEPRNGQMRMRLGFVLLEAQACGAAAPHFEAAIAAGVPSAEPHLGLAECLAAAGRGEAAARALTAADRIEPGNPVVLANLGMIALEHGRDAEAISRLRAALERAPDLDPARFALARAYGRTGQRAEAAREARTLLRRLPSDAPQRAEVERLLATVQ